MNFILVIVDVVTVYIHVAHNTIGAGFESQSEHYLAEGFRCFIQPLQASATIPEL
jgi:hypothetical protein